jgi:hypothetical protein
MSYLFRQRGAAVLILTAAAVGCSAPPEKETVESYKLTCTMKAITDDGQRKQVVEAESVLLYNFRRNVKEATLSFDSLNATMRIDGREAFNMAMDRTKLVLTQGGKTEEVSAETASEEKKQELKDCFGSPLCKITYDDEGKETSRTIVAGPGAKGFRDQGEIEKGLFFFPPFSTAADKWEAPHETRIPAGGVAKGNVTYEKVKTTGAHVIVKVSGVLSNDAFDNGDIIVKDARYSITGEAVYDTTKRRWISSTLKIDMSCALEKGGQIRATTKGAETWKMEALPEK